MRVSCHANLLLLFTFLLLLPAVNSRVLQSDELPIHTSSSHLLTPGDEKVNLACVNWYGAHMETYVNAGLNKRALGDISQDIVDAGFNCIRLPYSLDLWFNRDYVPPPVAVAGDPTLAGLTGWEIFDRTVVSLTDHKLVVFLNNHNSKAAWCCQADSPDGLWSNEYYNTSQWIESLAGLADHYKDNKYVIGMDLRNEIHDVPNLDPPLLITWGESKDIDLDWKVAVEASSKAIYEKNPDWLIIVSGLCYSFDLRKMVMDKPNIPQKNKLVWTVHYYSFSRWWLILENDVFKQEDINILGVGINAWEDVETLGVRLIILGAVMISVTAVSVFLLRRYKIINIHIFPRSMLVMWSANGALLVTYCTVGLIICEKASVMVREGYTQAGCATMALEADILDEVGFAMLVLAVIGAIAATGSCKLAEQQAQKNIKMVGDREKGIEMTNLDAESSMDLNQEQEEEDAHSAWCLCCQFAHYFVFMNIIFLCVLCVAAGGKSIQMAKKTATYDMLHDELYDKWMIKDRDTPVLLGEFGTSTHVNNEWWTHMMRFIDEYDLPYAYWPWNGERWYEEDNGDNEVQVGSFNVEGYGLVRDDWVTVKDEVQLSDLIRLADKEL
jgi:hypothetical protein